MLATVDISKAISIGGWMSERELLWLASQSQNCKTIVEFGCYFGRSTRALADNIQEGGKIWAVDPWSGDYFTETGNPLEYIDTYVMPYFLHNLKDRIDEGIVIPNRGFSYSFKLPFKVDMIFIDGDHRYNTVVRDINKAIEIVKSGGIISGHDYNHPLWIGVKKAVDEMLPNIQVEDTIWWTTLKS